jgi:hypothetical protein
LPYVTKRDPPDGDASGTDTEKVRGVRDRTNDAIGGQPDSASERSHDGIHQLTRGQGWGQHDDLCRANGREVMNQQIPVLAAEVAQYERVKHAARRPDRDVAKVHEPQLRHPLHLTGWNEQRAGAMTTEASAPASLLACRADEILAEQLRLTTVDRRLEPRTGACPSRALASANVRMVVGARSPFAG